MTGALAYLIGQTVRNRIARQVGRLRNPRYAVAMLLGIAYFAFIFGGPVTRNGRTAAPSMTAGAAGGPATAAVYLSVVLALFAAYWWLRGGVTGALAFQPGEVQLLFPAPISRRALIGYKIARSQLLILLNAVFWTLLMRRWGLTLPVPLRFVTAWAFFSILSLHRLAVALVQMPPLQGARRAMNLALKGAAVLLIVGLVSGVAPALRRLPQLGFETGVRELGNALSTPPASIVLFPFHVVTAPLAAPSTAAWVGAIALLVAGIALHLVFVLSMDVPFEEAAAQASVEMARRVAALRSRASGGATVLRPGKVKRDWLPLAPLGYPSVAVAWKNTLALARTGGIRTAVSIVALITLISLGLSSVSREGRTGGMALLPIGIVVGMTLFMGPRVLRNDLRQDLLALPLLKTYPLSGFEIVVGELASPTLVLTAVQTAMLVVGAFIVPPEMRAQLGGAQGLGVIVIAPVLFVAMNAATIAIQNGAALMFPSWVRLGADSGGVEALGQNLLVTIGSMLALVIVLLPPAIEVSVVYFLAKPLLHEYTAAVATLLAAGVLFAEVAWLVSRLGRTFEKTEPSALA